jgi:hypothetical protein
VSSVIRSLQLKRLLHDSVPINALQGHINRERRKIRLVKQSKKPNSLERETNRKTLLLAENLRAKRHLELQNGIYGFADNDKLNGSFLTYFEVLAEKRRDSDGNYSNWMSALNHLKKFVNADIKFSEIDRE